MYITDLKAISPQLTYTNEFLEGEITSLNNEVYNVVEPDYIEFIPKGLLRRMGKAVRMGVGTGQPLIKNHADIDAILMGTANGGLEDCIKFLNQIVEYDEGTLTPTNFVQSTPNAVAGQLALMATSRGYNITYTNGGHAFENVLLDALLLFEEGAHKKILVGGIEEISEYNFNIDSLANKYKKELVSSVDLLNSSTSGTVCGEGASMFILEKDAAEYYTRVLDVAQVTYPEVSDIDFLIESLLERNRLNINDIDAIMLGVNGDVNHKKWYDHVSANLFQQTNTFSFKNLTGDYRTSTAFAMWLTAHMHNGENKFIDSIQLRKSHNRENKHILIYNHFDEIRHSFILLSK